MEPEANQELSPAVYGGVMITLAGRFRRSSLQGNDRIPVMRESEIVQMIKETEGVSGDELAETVKAVLAEGVKSGLLLLTDARTPQLPDRAYYGMTLKGLAESKKMLEEYNLQFVQAPDMV